MTETAARPGAPRAQAPRRRLLASIPLWARVSGAIALILAGVLVSSMLLGAIGADESRRGGHGGGGSQTQAPHQGGSGPNHGSRGSGGSGGGHDARGDHTSGGHR